MVKHIFTEINTYLVKGIMIYDELAQAFSFLQMPGYEAVAVANYERQNKAYRDISAWYAEHYDALLPASDPEYATIIPGKWYDQSRNSIDRDEAALYLLTRWARWERESRDVYRRCYDDLLAEGEDAAACKVFELVVDAGVESIKAERCLGYEWGTDGADALD